MYRTQPHDSDSIDQYVLKRMKSMSPAAREMGNAGVFSTLLMHFLATTAEHSLISLSLAGGKGGLKVTTVSLHNHKSFTVERMCFCNQHNKVRCPAQVRLSTAWPWSHSLVWILSVTFLRKKQADLSTLQHEKMYLFCCFFFCHFENPLIKTVKNDC